MFRTLVLFLICFSTVFALAQEAPKQKQESKPKNVVPVISGELGSCSAEFIVRNSKLKPIYTAKIAVEIRYGFAGFRRTTLEIYTNVDGKARFEGLPESAGRPLAFSVSYNGRKAAVLVDPAERCHGAYTAVITDEPVKTETVEAESE